MNTEIRPVTQSELSEAQEVIHASFQTVAAEFGLTRENCPGHTSFLPLSHLQTQLDRGWRMYGMFVGEKIVGYASLSAEDADTFELHHLAVLPQYRHNGLGKQLLDYAKRTVIEAGGKQITLGIIDESAALKHWYLANGFVQTESRKFAHLPFTSGFLEWTTEQETEDM